jgi:hypothetical protein
MNSMRRHWIAVVGVVWGLVMPQVASASTEADVLRNLAADWRQWALSIPTPDNPMLDPTGENCVVGQRGSTWFLAGTFNGGSAVRDCTVPEGKEIFFPVINAMFYNSPNVCGQGPEDISVAEMRAVLAGQIAEATQRAAQLDGKSLRLRHVKSRVFEVALPEDNVFDAPCASAGGQPAGIFSPAVDEGYYVRLRPLSVGEHTLHFHAEVPEFDLVFDVTYHLTVVPVASR